MWVKGVGPLLELMGDNLSDISVANRPILICNLTRFNLIY